MEIKTRTDYMRDVFTAVRRRRQIDTDLAENPSSRKRLCAIVPEVEVQQLKRLATAARGSIGELMYAGICGLMDPTPEHVMFALDTIRRNGGMSRTDALAIREKVAQAASSQAELDSTKSESIAANNHKAVER
jgi:hypothetical protein